MRKFLYLTAALLLSWGCFAQNDIVRYRACNECSNVGLDQNAPANQVFTYGNATEYPVNLVADDYGPRQNGADIYDWHGGIDYNSATGNNDMGDLILAIMGGTITGSLGAGYKRLIVQAGGPNYGYGHLFISDAGNNALPRLCCMNRNLAWHKIPFSSKFFKAILLETGIPIPVILLRHTTFMHTSTRLLRTPSTPWNRTLYRVALLPWAMISAVHAHHSASSCASPHQTKTLYCLC